MSDIEAAIQESMRKCEEVIEAQLLKFFGSYERALKMANSLSWHMPRKQSM